MNVDAINQFRTAIIASGLTPPNYILPGKLHRFPGLGKSRSNRAGFCQLFDDCLAGYFGDWSRGFKETWKVEREVLISHWVTEKFNQQLREKKAVQIRKQESKYKKTAGVTRGEWEEAETAHSTHPYLVDRGVTPIGLRVNKHNQLLAPIYDGDEIVSIQYISPTGEKKFKYGGKIQGCYFPIGITMEPKETYICEGVATGLTLYEHGPDLVVIAFNCGNLPSVAERICWRFPDTKILIAGDNDHSTKGNPGLSKAMEAAARCGGDWTVPDFTGLSPGPKDTDFNDLRRLQAARDE